MPRVIPPGLYLVSHPKLLGLISHYGILMMPREGPIRVFELNDKGCALVSPEQFSYGEGLTVHYRLPPEQVRPALVRAWQLVRERPSYHLFANNCEHAARWVAEGRRESPQAGRGLVAALLLCVGILSS